VIGASVGIPILALSVYGLIKFFPLISKIPEPQPVLSTQQGTHPGDLPPSGANTATPPENTTNVPFQRPEIEAAARVGVADDLMKQAEAERLLLCRVARYCKARNLYDSIQRTLETIRSCSANCDEMKLRAESRQAYIESRLAEYKAPITDTTACVVDQEICACVALGAGSDCQ